MDNVGLICKECADDRKKAFQSNHSIDDIEVDSNVKVAFTHEGITEHMWVLVKKIEGNIIFGTLNNDPARITAIKYNDPVQCEFEDIQAML